MILLTGYENYDSLEPCIKTITIEEVVNDATDTRNDMITYGGQAPNEIAFGKKKADIPELENMMPQQLETEPNMREQARILRQKNAMDAYLQVRQRIDLQKDLLCNLKTDGISFCLCKAIAALPTMTCV